MMSNSSSKTWFVIAIGFLAAFFLVWLNFFKGNHEVVLDQKKLNDSNAIEMKSTPHVQTTAVSQVVPAIKRPAQIPVTTDAVFAKWRAERGYAVLLGISRGEEYKDYDDSTLEQLAKAGDGFAVDALAKKAVIKGRESVEQVLKNAAARGSTEALFLAGNYAHAFTKNASEEERRAGVVETLAWYNVAALRGDKSPNLEARGSLLNSNNITLTKEEGAQIEKRSNDIYNDLQQQRTAMGLGDFDNSVPPEVKAYFDDIEANTSGLYKR